MRQKSARITYAELVLVCAMRNSDADKYILPPQRKKYKVKLTDEELLMLDKIYLGFPTSISNEVNLIKVLPDDSFLISEKEVERVIPKDKPTVLSKMNKSVVDSKDKIITAKEDKSKEARIEELESILDIRSNSNVEVYELAKKSEIHEKSKSIVICLLSDVHIEETVEPETVLNLNSYNPEIAKARLDSFFVNSAKLISHAQRSYEINEVVLGCLGDVIGNWIHDELMQTNSMSPLAAISFAKSSIMSGLKYWNDNLSVEKVTFIGVVGNHGRTTKKSQFANATDVSMEYFMYKDMEEMSKILGLNKIEFIVPKSEMAIVTIFDKRLLFTHGTNIKYGGGIGGLIVPVTRWFGRLSQTLKIDMAFLGHFHQSVFTKKFCVNGSTKGFDSYAFGKGLDFEAPQQTMLILHEKYGFTNYSTIYLE